MKIAFCFVVLLSLLHSSVSEPYGEDDPKIWDRGWDYTYDQREICSTETIKLPDKKAVVEREKSVHRCRWISFVEWRDFEENIAIVTVPEGDVGTQYIKIRIEAREYLNGILKMCSYPMDWGCLPAGCC